MNRSRRCLNHCQGFLIRRSPYLEPSPFCNNKNLQNLGLMSKFLNTDTHRYASQSLTTVPCLRYLPLPSRCTSECPRYPAEVHFLEMADCRLFTIDQAL